MLALHDALEVSLIVSAITYGLLFFYVLLYKDGATWNVFRWSVAMKLAYSLAGGAVVHFGNFEQIAQGNGPVQIALWAVILTRIAASATSVLLAIHLRESIRQSSGVAAMGGQEQ